MYSQTDFLLQQEFKLGDARRIQVSLNVLNLFNEENPINYWYTELPGGTGIVLNETEFYLKQTPAFETLKAAQGVGTDPRFLQDSVWQTPIDARFGVKFIF